MILRLRPPPVTTAPASTIERSASIQRAALALSSLVLLAIPACGLRGGERRAPGTIGLGMGNREDPALSSRARLLASVIASGGRRELLLQEQPSGRRLPVGPLSRWTPHQSPSLSRNGRYLALLVRQGDRSLPVLWDRASGTLHRLPLPMGQEARRIHLSPDARTLAIEVDRDGRDELRLFDLRGMLEPDLPSGLLLQGGGASSPQIP